jgi:hypothetical protein
MAIENRNLAVGTRLVASYKKQTYVCIVEAAEEGESVLYALEDGKKFKSPSAAASAVMNGQAANGWRFWSVEGEATTPASASKAARGRTKADKAGTTATPERKRARKQKAYRIIRPTDNQEDVPEGQVRYWCDACMASFLGFADAEPSQCPNGHRIDDPELTSGTGLPEDAATEAEA